MTGQYSGKDPDLILTGSGPVPIPNVDLHTRKLFFHQKIICTKITYQTMPCQDRRGIFVSLLPILYENFKFMKK
jgi:hypothetical protein